MKSVLHPNVAAFIGEIMKLDHVNFGRGSEYFDWGSRRKVLIF